MDVSVIIVNYNTYQMTVECINSVFEKTKDLSFEVILIDNASNDESKKCFERDERIKYVYSYENMGFGRANNVGMMLAKGEYLFLLNSDTLLVNNAIKVFYDYAESHEKLAFYGCWLEDKNGNFIHSCAKLPSAKNVLFNCLAGYVYQLNKKINTSRDEISYTKAQKIAVGYVTGADLFLHRKIYEYTGGFDHNYFMYYEESDWQHTCAKLGFPRYCINNPRIKHFIGGSQIKGERTKKRKFSMNAFRMKSEIYYVHKFSPWYYYIFFRFLYAIISIPIIFFKKENTREDILPSLHVLLFGK